jgi:glycosyltransferase involved in cell wall biosynthesis
MIRGKKIVVVMPAYNAEKTLVQTYREVMDQGVVDQVILVDDRSRDSTVRIAELLPGVRVHVHPQNRGYGSNQKTCYRLALEENADVIIMVHPDYQYTPLLIPAMAHLITNGLYHFVLGSRILGGYARSGGMPWWKYLANRALTAGQNWLMGAKLSEYHTGYRAYSRELLERLNLEHNSDDFVFDNEFIAQALWLGYSIAEISCPTRYFAEASSISFRRSLVYGIGCLRTAFRFAGAKWLGLPRPHYLPGTAEASRRVK